MFLMAVDLLAILFIILNFVQKRDEEREETLKKNQTKESYEYK